MSDTSQTGTATRTFFLQRSTEGWERFVERYSRKLLGWCRGWGLTPADAEEVTQIVLARLYQIWQTTYRLWDPQKGSLRSWLRQVARNAWVDSCKARKHALGQTGSDVDQLLENAATRDDFVERFAEVEALQLAKEQTRARVTAGEWEAFRLRIFEQCSADETGRQLNLSVGSVNNYTSKVRKVFKEEIEALDSSSHSSSETTS
jgi:RNA polymerase sigma factor (sigma-70 family)